MKPCKHENHSDHFPEGRSRQDEHCAESRCRCRAFGAASAVIDIDPKASAKCWHDLRESDARVVVSIHASRLSSVVEAAKENGAALVIIDTAPHSESSALAAARAADLVLSPYRPSLLDLKAIVPRLISLPWQKRRHLRCSIRFQEKAD